MFLDKEAHTHVYMHMVLELGKKKNNSSRNSFLKYKTDVF